MMKRVIKMKNDNIELESFLNYNFDEILNDGEMLNIAIYFNTSDLPGKYVARVFKISAGNVIPTRVCIIKDSIEEIRSNIPKCLNFIPRCDRDDEVIIGTYI
jgi:hypothetical protein